LSCGADIDPDVLYYGLKPAWMEGEHASAASAHEMQKQVPAGLAVRESTAPYDESAHEEELTS
jgi:hypothetical protein